jgi:hypothetical protein
MSLSLPEGIWSAMPCVHCGKPVFGTAGTQQAALIACEDSVKPKKDSCDQLGANQETHFCCW